MINISIFLISISSNNFNVINLSTLESALENGKSFKINHSSLYEKWNAVGTHHKVVHSSIIHWMLVPKKMKTKEILSSAKTARKGTALLKWHSTPVSPWLQKHDINDKTQKTYPRNMIYSFEQCWLWISEKCINDIWMWKYFYITYFVLIYN